jgi:hypothetical protein
MERPMPYRFNYFITRKEDVIMTVYILVSSTPCDDPNCENDCKIEGVFDGVYAAEKSMLSYTFGNNTETQYEIVSQVIRGL